MITKHCLYDMFYRLLSVVKTEIFMPDAAKAVSWRLLLKNALKGN
jgi:hypothetical protein